MSSGKNPFDYAVPPHNIEAEAALISAILMDNSTLLDVLEIVSPEDFYKTVHKKIFECIRELFTKDEPVDVITLSDQLKQKNSLDEIGGTPFLASLIDSIPMATNPQQYARIIRDNALLRELIGKSNDIARRCFEATQQADEIIDFAESAIFEISGESRRKNFYHIGQILDQNISALEDLHANRALITGVPTGFTQFDSLTSGCQRSDLIIIAARPSMGKTALALNIARNAAVDAGIPVAIFSLEMSKEQLSLRLLCSEARVDSSKVRSGFLTGKDWEKITEAASVLNDAPIFIDDSPDITAMTIRTKARRLKMEHDIGLVIIDYLQLMRGRSNAERRELEISEISRSLKSLAKELNLPVMALSQLNRKLEERSDKRPQLSDLRESGALEQDADVVAFIYRDEVYNKDENNPNRGKAEIILAKQRNGPVGIAHLVFLSAYTRFENAAPEHSIG